MDRQLPDELRFGHHASMYAQFRPRYPEAVYDTLLDSAAGRAHVVELGAGTGQVASRLTEHFSRVTAVEPDPDMAAEIAGDPKITVIVQRAEETELPPRSADAIVAATAFHWMQTAMTVSKVKQILRSGGVFFPFSIPSEREFEYQPAAVREVINNEGQIWQDFKAPPVAIWLSYVDLLQPFAFARLEPWQTTSTSVWTAAHTAGFYLATSFGGAYARETGDPRKYFQDLTAKITEAAGEELIHVRIQFEGALAFVD